MRILQKRQYKDKCVRIGMIAAVGSVVLFMLFMVVMLADSAKDVLADRSLSDILFSSQWDLSENLYGIAPAIVGTLIVTTLSMLIAVPLAVLGAIYLAEYAKGKMKTVCRVAVDVLASIPSVVYGLCGLLVIVPFVRDVLGPLLGVQTTGMCVLTASVVLAIMVLPVIVSITADSLSAVPTGLKEQFFSLGSTKLQMIEQVLLKAGGSGIVSGIVLGFGRALGETIAVAMVIGNKNVISASLLSPGQTMSGLIINHFSEVMSIPSDRSALMLVSLILLLIILFFNVMASAVRNQLRKKWRYE